MITFKQYLAEGAVRSGLPHAHSMDPKQFHGLIKSGNIHFKDMTEKTDGQAMVFGHDHEGFYTQSSGSGTDKMRSPEDYETRAKKRAEETGKEYSDTSSKAFGHIHATLAANKPLLDHLKSTHEKTGEDVKVRGESFYKPWGRPSEIKGETKFVGTSYDPSHMGKVGKFVIHSKLAENSGHDLEHFKKHLSDSNINFDDDKIDKAHSKLDVSAELADHKKLDHDLIASRKTKSNGPAKEAELEKLKSIQNRVSAKVDDHVASLGIKPKWGSQTEGAVIHPHEDQPRFKVTSQHFRNFKKSDEAKNLIKRPEPK